VPERQQVIFQKETNPVKIKIPKAIWAIIVTISITVFCFFALPSFWFWTCWEILAAGMVAVGCGGEWYLFLNPAKEGQERAHRRRELQFITGIALGVAMEFLALAHVIPEAVRLENKVEETRNQASLTESKNLALRTNVASLEKGVIELAHLYDLSTNALAEANARLLAIRPLKERLVDCVNDIDSGIIPALKGGKTTFQLSVPMYKFNRLVAIAGERGSSQYIKSVVLDPALVLEGGVGQVQRATIEFKPELAK